MANRTRITKTGVAGKQSNTSNQPTLLSAPNPRSNEKTEDVIVSLSDAYENRRARQVGEWERLYSDNIYRAV